MHTRLFEEKDYEMMKEWCEGRSSVCSRDLLPKHGFIAMEGDKPIMMAFLYLTDSATCFFKCVVTNPESNQIERSNALKWLVGTCSEIAKHKGYKIMGSNPSTEGLAMKFQDAGFGFYKDKVFMCEKEI